MLNNEFMASSPVRLKKDCSTDASNAEKETKQDGSPVEPQVGNLLDSRHIFS